MSKLTLDMNTFKALASDTRLDILRALDGKKLSLNDICKATNLNKATLHEHLAKLNEAGLVKKKERDGHKWVYYKLTWKGEGLLHPENTRIVVMFSTTFISLLIAVILIVNFLQPIPIGIAETINDTTYLYEVESVGIPILGERSYNFRYLAEVDAREKTVMNITKELQQNANIKNSIGENYADEEIAWRHAGTIATASFDGYGGADDADVSPSNVAAYYVSVPKGNVETLKFSLNSEPIKADQQILLPNVDLYQDFGSNDKVFCTGAPFHIVTPYNKLYPTSPFCKFFYINTLLEKLKIGDTIDYNEINEYPEGFDGDDNETNETLYADASFRFKGEEKSLTGYYPAVPTIIATVQDTTLLYLAVACLIFFGALFTIALWRFKVNKKPKI